MIALTVENPVSKRDKIILICGKITEFCLYLAIFTSMFSKAAVEVFFSIGFTAYFIKKLLISKTDKRSVVLFSTKLDFPLLAFLFANIIAVIVSQNFIPSLKGFITRVSQNLAFYIMTLDVILSTKNDKTKNFVLVIIVTVLMLAVNSGFQCITGKDMFRHFAMAGRRLSASVGSPNTLAAWLILVTPLVFCVGIMGRIKKSAVRLVLIILSCLLIFFIFLTYSRAAWLGLICSALFMMLVKDKRMLLFFLLVAVFFSLFILLYPDSMTEFQAEYAKYHILIRLNLWEEAIGLIKHYPFFGVGMKNYLSVIPKYQIHRFNLPISQIGETSGLYPHNGYLQMAAEIGLVGLGCFLWMLWELFWNSIKSLKLRPEPVFLGLVSGLLAFLVSVFFDNHLNKIELCAMFWITLALAASFIREHKQNLPNA